MSTEIKQRGSLELTMRRLLSDRAGMASTLFIVLLVIVATGADGIAALTGHSPVAQFLSTGLTPTGLPVPPSGEFLFGTDQLGRDVLVRLAYGARISLAIGVVASLLAAVIGVTVGLVAGYFGGWIDVVLGRLMDLVMSIPVLLCMLSLVAVFGPSVSLSLTVIVFFSWTTMGRVIRGQVLSLKEREFVLASRSMGAGHLSIMFTDILPNLGAPIIIYATMMVPTSIIFEATLSFLGLGIVPPAPSWGGMLAEAANNSIYMFAWWLVLFPGLALLFTTLSFNILGDALRDALDPASMRNKVHKKKKKSVGAAS